MPLRILLLVAIPCLTLTLSLEAQDGTVARARRLSDIATIAVEEYEQGVRDGRVIQTQEYAEARLFIAAALREASVLGPTARAAAVPSLRALGDGIETLAPPESLRAVLRALRAALSAAVGETLDPLPEAAPSLEFAASAYATSCAGCHGSDGAGAGPLAGGLDPAPADLTDRAELRDVAPIEFFRKINVGVAGTAMPGFADRLDVDTRWALAFYVATLRHSEADARGGEALAREGCEACAILVSDAARTVLLSDAELERELAVAYGAPLGEEAAALVAFARRAGAVESLGGDRRLAAARVSQRAAVAASEARDLALAGDREGAGRKALDAYLGFEGIETAVRARNAAAARRVEEAFTELRVAVAGDDHARTEAAVLAVRDALDRAVRVTRDDVSAGVLVGQSLVIMLREGLEAILIVGALVAFLSRAGAGDRKREIGFGVVAAGGASLFTAAVFATIFRRAAAHRETLEGVTMLAAAAVLFWVSYWLVSKIEVRQWQAFVRGQMERALASRRTWALGLVAFLAVYREGFETVLFYAALFTSTGRSLGNVSAILLGMLAGGIVLALVYWGVARVGGRLPLRPFFAGTSAVLYLMAFSFAGQGVAELQLSGIIPATPLSWAPSVPALGIFPTTQTVLTQLVVAGALVGALAWVFWLAPRPEPLRDRG